MTGFTDEAMAFLINNKWRGNVRELENAVDRAVIMSDGTKVKVSDFISSEIEGADISPECKDMIINEFENAFCLTFEDTLPTLENVINDYVAYAVDHNNGAKDKTAREIGIDRKTLYKRILSSEP